MPSYDPGGVYPSVGGPRHRDRPASVCETVQQEHGQMFLGDLFSSILSLISNFFDGVLGFLGNLFSNLPFVG